MNKKKQINFNLNNFLLAISVALDSKEENYNKNISKNHSKRVAFLSLLIAKKLNLSESELSDLCAYSLSYKLIKEDELNISLLPFESHKNIFNKDSILNEIVDFSYLINSSFDLSKNDINQRETIVEFVKENINKNFTKESADSFLDITSYINFWMNMQNENEILLYIYSNLNDFTKALDFEDLLKITRIFTNMLDNENDIIEKCEKMCNYYEFEHKDKYTFLVAASLQNIGKLMISNNILLKTSKLDKNEYELIKSYPYYTKMILNSIMGFNDISNLASKVQETLDGKGYPSQTSSNDLSFKDRLLSTLNIYNSLQSNKVYRKGYSHKDTIEIMEDLAISNKIDKSIIKDINTIFSK